MATKSTKIELSAEEIKYQRKVKSIELAIRATVGKNGAMIGTIIKSADEIFKYINQ